MEDIRRGAIMAGYHLSNRELAEEVDALRKLVKHLTIFIDTITLKLVMEEHPEAKKIIEEKP